MASQQIVDFQPISSPHFPYLPEEVVENLSWDQYLLYRFVQAIVIGEWDDDLAMLQPGPLCHSRWLTLTQIMLCLYVRITRPILFCPRRLTTDVIMFYAPSWFRIKCHPLCTDGPKHPYSSMPQKNTLQQQLSNVMPSMLTQITYFLLCLLMRIQIFVNMLSPMC